MFQFHGMSCERKQAFSTALASFSAAADNIALQLKTDKASYDQVENGKEGTLSGVHAVHLLCKTALSQLEPPEELSRLGKEKHLLLLECLRGMARCAFKAGELQKGLQLAVDLDSPIVYRQCAESLLSIQQHRHAAALLSRAGDPERAASIYIEVRPQIAVAQ